ncbi:MAG: sigma-70 family RNA polymerase sigma factor [Tannerella sp.]|jgi:RNA polymerase sigma-70 factor (ECF subfamily)|nr:sigma-70 family RNA polymerase sigma factor [Tannerella sp.]
MEHKDLIESLYVMHARDLYAYGLSFHPDSDMVEDAIHDVFLDITIHEERLAAIRDMKTYLLSSLRHRLTFLLKKDKLYIPFTDNDTEFGDYENDAQTLWIEREEETDKALLVKQVLSQLKPRQREALHLRFVEGFSFEEIAGMMHINRQSVQNLLQRTINKFRKGFITTL